MTPNKLLIAGLVVVAVLAIGADFVLRPAEPTVVAGSPTGSTFNDAKVATVNLNLANTGANGTSTSILNNSGSDRYVLGPVVACEGLGTSQAAYAGGGLASLTLVVSTSSTASPASTTPTIQVGNLTIATSTVNFLLASSTSQTATTSFAAIWSNNAYMTFQTNATNTGVCNVGVQYLQG